MTFQVGELDELISILRPQSVSDGAGGKIAGEPIVVGKNIWAKRRPLSGKEFLRYDQVNATSMCAFVMRYRKDILPSDVIVADGIKYNIRFIPPVSVRSDYIVVEAESGVAT